MPSIWAPSEAVAVSAEGAEGELFDGTSARRHAVRVAADGAGLLLAGPEVPAERIDPTRLAFVDSPPGAQTYGHADRPGWRLRLFTPLPPDVAALLPATARFGGWIDRVGLGRAALLAGLASAAVVALVISLPAWLGPLVPMSVERQIGDSLLGDLHQHSCSTPASEAALAALAAELDPDQPPVKVQLVRMGVVNAAAVPGGRVLLFDGLVQQAKSSDELAGVIGHEIGHVRKRHVMQAMLREFGLSMVLRGSQTQLAGTLGQVAEMRYSRGAEAEADNFSRARMAQADVSPADAGAFFERLAAKDPVPRGGPLSWFASHPDPELRAGEFRAGVQPGRNYRPALSEAQFAAIKAACGADKRSDDKFTW